MNALRRLLLLFAALLVLAVLALAAAPWWLGGALRVAGQHWGFTFSRYERVGYARFRVHDFRMARDNWAVTAERAEAPGLAPWLRSRFGGPPGEATVDGWAVEVERRAGNAPASNKPSGWNPLQRRLREKVNPILLRLPHVVARHGRVAWPGQELRFAETSWKDRKLRTAVAYSDWPEAQVEGFFDAQGVLIAEVVVSARETRGHFQLLPESLQGGATVLGNAADVNAAFADAGWWPRQAQVKGMEWRLPAEMLRVGQLYESVTGKFIFDWDGDRFHTDLDFAAQSRAKGVPSLKVVTKISGTPDRVRVAELQVEGPGVAAHLDAPVEIERGAGLRSGPSYFALDVDLAAQPWIKGRGKLQGVAEVAAATARAAPEINFRLTGEQLAWEDFAEMARFEVSGRLDWPTLKFDRVLAAGAGAEKIEATGELDLRAHEIKAAHLQGILAGSRLRRWLPPTWSIESLAGEIRASGPWSAPEHTGHLEGAAVTVGGLKPLAASASWTGAGASFPSVEFEARRGALRFVAAGGWTAPELRIDSAQLERPNTLLWELEQPSTFSWRSGLLLGDTRFSGPSGQIQAEITATGGRADVQLTRPDLTWLGELWAVPPLPAALHLQSVAVAGKWTGEDPAEFTLQAVGEYRVAENRMVLAHLAGHSDGDEWVIDRLDFSDDTRAFALARGRLPLAIFPGRKPWWRLETRRPIELEASTEPYREFWDELAAPTGFQLANPSGRLSIKGTLDRPQGMLDLTADSAALDPARFGVNWPAVEKLVVHASARDSGLQLDELSFQVDGQPARATGKLDFDAEAWRRLATGGGLPDWRNADLKLQVDHAQLAPFARYLPRFLAPQGTLTVDLGLKPGGEIGGRLEIIGAATRPLGSLGAVQEIAAEIGFAGRRAEFRRFTATIGGEPVSLDGEIELPESGEPRVNVALRGQNIPLARQPGLVVRGDLNLKATTPDDGPTRLSGTLQLRDSLYVANLRSLVPGEKRSGPARPPPYFSVEPAPLNTWQLDVKLAGDRFLRVRTPLFRGLVSAQFKLGGTLGDPVATGEARIDDGTVLFPFAGFKVEQGRVTLTPERPREPQLNVGGTTLRSGYDLRLDLTGTPARPNVVFSSRPSLSSEQILLLIMAGEVPSTGTTDPLSGVSQQRFAQLGAYLGRNLFTTFGGDPAGADRLTITTGERLSRQGQETLEVEYELGRRWSVVGEYDEYDDYNVGVKYKILRHNSDEKPREP